MLKISGSHINENNEGYPSLYCLKALGALFVVCLHFYNWESGYMYYIVYPILTTAVPFFFMISGFFLYRDNSIKATLKCRKALDKISWITLYAIVFYYMAYNLQKNAIPFNDVNSFVAFLFYGTSGHLWYMIAYIEVLVIMLIALRLNKVKILMGLAPLFYVFCLLMGSYNFLDLTTPFQRFIVRNFLTLGIPCFGVGWMLKRYESKVRQYADKIVLLFCLSYIILVIEIIWDFKCAPYKEYMMFTIPTAAAMMMFFISRPALGKGSIFELIGKKYSAGIYIYHILIGNLIVIFNQQYHIIPAIILPIIIFVCSVAFTYIWDNALKKVISK